MQSEGKNTAKIQRSRMLAFTKRGASRLQCHGIRTVLSRDRAALAEERWGGARFGLDLTLFIHSFERFKAD